MKKRKAIVDGNEAASYITYKTNEVCAIYPITPASPMGEHVDAWSAIGRKNIWGQVPNVVELQSEGGTARRTWFTSRRSAHNNLHLIIGDYFIGTERSYKFSIPL